MRYSTVPSSDAVKADGLPHSVGQINPRVIVAAFRDEGAAVMFARQLNGTVDAEAEATGGESMADRMVPGVEVPEDEESDKNPPARTIEVGAGNTLAPNQQSLAEKIAAAQAAKG